MKVAVTGATGFVGKALTKELLKRDFEVIGIARSDVPAELYQSDKLSWRRFDLSLENKGLSEVFAGIEGVFHTAAKVGLFGRLKEFMESNFFGTKRLLQASKEAGVKRFIYTSSPSVIACGKDLKGVDESVPYPTLYNASYPYTKALGECAVLEANTATFRTLSLRPHLIFGPNDTNLIPKLLDRGRKGRLVKIGEREPLVDFTFIGDCVQAHIKAFTSLERNDLPSGKAYFISQGEPYPFWEWVNKMLEYNKVPPVTKRINKHLAYTVATLLEGVGVASGYRFEPPLTRFLVDELATDHYFSIERAKSLLQFSPSISINDALKETFL